MYNGEGNNNKSVNTPNNNGAYSSHHNPATQPDDMEAVDKMENAQRSAQDELSQALHEERTKAYRAGTVPSIEHTARIAVTPKTSAVESGDIKKSPFAKEDIRSRTEHMTSGPGETIQVTPHSVIAREDSASLKPSDNGYVPHPKLKTLRTMQSDMAHIVGTQNESMTSIALAAHKKRMAGKEVPQKQSPTEPGSYEVPIRAEVPKQTTETASQKTSTPPVLPKTETPTNPIPQYKPLSSYTGSMRSSYINQVEPIPVKRAFAVPFLKNVIILILSIVLVGLGGFGLYSVFFAKKVQNTEVEISQPTTLVHFDTFSDVSFSARNTLVSAIRTGEGSLPNNTGSVWYAHIKDTSIESLLETLSPRVPSVFARTTKEPVAIGYYRNGSLEPRFYMALTVSTFGQAFSGSLQWEKVMYQDIQELLYKNLDGTMYGFVDAIIGNQDVRKLINTNGTPFIVYGFIDQNTFVLAEDDETFAAIANNIFSQKSVR